MRYGSLFLSVSGTYALPPVLSAWIANNSEPHYRRATSIALMFASTNIVRPTLVPPLLFFIVSLSDINRAVTGWYSQHVAFPEERSPEIYKDHDYVRRFVSKAMTVIPKD